MTTAPPFTQERLRELFDYDAENGALVRKTSGYGYRKGQLLGSKSHLDGYVIGCVDRHYSPVHRIVWLYVYGTWPKIIDHIDRNPANNRVENLRASNHVLNAQNTKLSARNKSGYTGVCRDKKRWRAEIRADGRNIRLGTFDTPEQASVAYLEAKKQLHIAAVL